MSLEWFSRMENAVRISLPDVCEGFEEFEILFDTDTTLQHPAFIFSIHTVDHEDEFCVVNFDPVNQEFYSFYYHNDADLESKVIFTDLDQMLSYIHASFHEFIGDVDEEDMLEEDLDDIDDADELLCDDDEEEYEEIEFSGGDIEIEDEDIEWITNDKHIHIEDNTPEHEAQYMIHLKLGRVRDSGDGVLFRNTITKQDDEESEEAVMFFFKEEEAAYIADLVNEYSRESSAF